jgi:hypothetical protein
VPLEQLDSCGNPACNVCNGSISELQPLLDRIAQQAAARQREIQRRERAEARLNEDTVDEKVNTLVICECDICKFKMGQTRLRNGVVRDYSYRPCNLRFQKTKTDRFNYFLGVELETDMNDRRVRNEVAAAMRKPFNFWFPKHDGSVTGPEFVSHPATLDWWRSRKKTLNEMFENLLHAGYSSHNGNRCGMHVNISRTAFEGEEHMYRFLTLLHGNAPWAIKMAQRTADSANQWAKLNLYTKEQRRKAANATFTSYRGQNGLGKYTALGTPTTGDRFEFRLPRGNLNINRFYKNLEWTVAMIEYSRSETRASNMTSAKFMKWVMARREEYSYLADFIVEKFGARYSNATA